MLDRLYDGFRRLLRTPVWEKCVDGGAAFVEVKRSADGKGWHPHLHVIVVGRFLPAKLLSQTWYAVTKDSWIVDVRTIADPRKARQYVVKYATKPCPVSVVRDEQSLREAMSALHGRRLITTFGSWRGTPLRPKQDPGDYEPICTIACLLDACFRGEAAALAIWAELSPSRRMSEVEARSP
jgi:hypothetical protein